MGVVGMNCSKLGRHKIACKSLQSTIRHLNRDADVQRIILGEARSFRHCRTPGAIEITDIDAGGVRIVAYDEYGKRELYIKTSQPLRIADFLSGGK